MILNDRLTMGFIAGLVGGVAMNVFDLLSFHLGIAELRYLDWASAVIYSSMAKGFAEAAFAAVVQIITVGILGIVFAYLMNLVSSRNHLLKGWLFGIVVWFVLQGMTLLFNVGQTAPIRLDTAASDLLGASVYGLVLAAALRWLEHRVAV